MDKRAIAAICDETLCHKEATLEDVLRKPGLWKGHTIVDEADLIAHLRALPAESIPKICNQNKERIRSILFSRNIILCVITFLSVEQTRQFLSFIETHHLELLTKSGAFELTGQLDPNETGCFFCEGERKQLADENKQLYCEMMLRNLPKIDGIKFELSNILAVLSDDHFKDVCEKIAAGEFPELNWTTLDEVYRAIVLQRLYEKLPAERKSYLGQQLVDRVASGINTAKKLITLLGSFTDDKLRWLVFSHCMRSVTDWDFSDFQLENLYPMLGDDGTLRFMSDLLVILPSKHAAEMLPQVSPSLSERLENWSDVKELMASLTADLKKLVGVAEAQKIVKLYDPSSSEDSPEDFSDVCSGLPPLQQLQLCAIRAQAMYSGAHQGKSNPFPLFSTHGQEGQRRAQEFVVQLKAKTDLAAAKNVLASLGGNYREKSFWSYLLSNIKLVPEPVTALDYALLTAYSLEDIRDSRSHRQAIVAAIQTSIGPEMPRPASG